MPRSMTWAPGNTSPFSAEAIPAGRQFRERRTGPQKHSQRLARSAYPRMLKEDEEEVSVRRPQRLTKTGANTLRSASLRRYRKRLSRQAVLLRRRQSRYPAAIGRCTEHRADRVRHNLFRGRSHPA